MKAPRRDHVEVVHVALPPATDKQTTITRKQITIYQLIDYR